jgi:hypothetical protein
MKQGTEASAVIKARAVGTEEGAIDAGGNYEYSLGAGVI